MKASYDRKTDTLSFILKEGVTVAESDEAILGHPRLRRKGDLVSMEILTLPNA